MELQNRI